MWVTFILLAKFLYQCTCKVLFGALGLHRIVAVNRIPVMMILQKRSFKHCFWSPTAAKPAGKSVPRERESNSPLTNSLCLAAISYAVNIVLVITLNVGCCPTNVFGAPKTLAFIAAPAPISAIVVFPINGMFKARSRANNFDEVIEFRKSLANAATDVLHGIFRSAIHPRPNAVGRVLNNAATSPVCLRDSAAAADVSRAFQVATCYECLPTTVTLAKPDRIAVAAFVESSPDVSNDDKLSESLPGKVVIPSLWQREFDRLESRQDNNRVSARMILSHEADLLHRFAIGETSRADADTSSRLALFYRLPEHFATVFSRSLSGRLESTSRPLG